MVSAIFQFSMLLSHNRMILCTYNVIPSYLYFLDFRLSRTCHIRVLLNWTHPDPPLLPPWITWNNQLFLIISLFDYCLTAACIYEHLTRIVDFMADHWYLHWYFLNFHHHRCPHWFPYKQISGIGLCIRIAVTEVHISTGILTFEGFECICYGSITILGVHLSQTTMLMIAIDRLFCIRYPHHYRIMVALFFLFVEVNWMFLNELLPMRMNIYIWTLIAEIKTTKRFIFWVL